MELITPVVKRSEKLKWSKAWLPHNCPVIRGFPMVPPAFPVKSVKAKSPTIFTVDSLCPTPAVRMRSKMKGAL
jgi:hypothetical protein